MGRKLHYKPGSFYRTDDRTGFPTRAENTRMEWTGLIVDQARWEIRQPQDLVKGVPDFQWVPDARPLGQNIYVGPISVQTMAAAIVGQTNIVVETTFGFYVGARIGCMLDLDGGSVFWTTIAADGGTELTSESGLNWKLKVGSNWCRMISVQPGPNPFLTLAKGLPFTMAAGNLITLYKPSPSVMAVPPS